MRVLLFVFLLIGFSYASQSKELIWDKGTTLLTFFDKYNIPKEVYFSLSRTDKELCTEIIAGVSYNILLDDNGRLKQALIPISEEMQLHIKKENQKYILDIIPIEFQEKTEILTIPIQSSAYIDILKHTENKALANELLRTFKDSIAFKKMQKNDLVSIKYTQRIRLGKYFGMPRIHGAMVEVRKNKNFIFKNPKDGQYYDDKARSFDNNFFKIPLRYKRISSKFTYKRYHPILKKYRTHLGVDYAANSGRRINATADGKIVHRGNKGGYGKTIIIRHKDGYKSLYAHMSNFKSGLKVGSYVKQGQHIGYVGSTGRSTGPHLHFGIYKNGRAKNPQKLATIKKDKLSTKSKQDYLTNIKKIKTELINSIKKTENLKLDRIVNSSQFKTKEG